MTGQEGINNSGKPNLVPHSEFPDLMVLPHLKDVPRHKLGSLIWDSSRQGTARLDPAYKKPWSNKKERKALKRAKVAKMKGAKV